MVPTAEAVVVTVAAEIYKACLLYNGCRAYLEEVAHPSFEEFCSYYEEQAAEKGLDIAPTLTYIRPLRDRKIIDGNPYRWELGSGKLTVFLLSEYPESLRALITEMILWSLWGYSSVNGDKDNPFIVIFDECQHLSYKPESPIMPMIFSMHAIFLRLNALNYIILEKLIGSMDNY